MAQEITNERMDYLRLRLVQFDNLKKLPLPTPHIGCSVVFWPHGDSKEPVAAIVTKQDGPGVIGLRLLRHCSQNNDTAVGIHYKNSPHLAANPNLLKLKNGGCWDYCEGDTPTSKHGKLHVQEIDRNIASVQEELRVEREREIQRRQQEEERQAQLAAATSTKSGKAEKQMA